MWVRSDERGFDLAVVGVEDVVQCVTTLLSTIEGEVFLDRRLGLDPSLLDVPQSELSLLYEEVYEKLEYYEPRVIVKEVRLEAGTAEGKAVLMADVEIREEVDK